MGRLVAIDYGLKRTGLAATDPMQIIASPLETIPTEQLIDWMHKYIQTEEVEGIVLGMPINLDGSETHTTVPVKKLYEKLQTLFPELTISLEDERFTSKLAQKTMIAGGMKKKDRRNKANVDKISATIILQSFMERSGL